MSKRVTTLFSLFCISLIAWFLAKATFALRETALDTPGSASRLTEHAAAAPEPLSAFDGITARNLLGVSVFPPEARRSPKGGTGTDSGEESERLSAEGIDALPISKQGWKLLGTIVDTGPGKASRAVIQVNGTERPYREGDTIQGWKIALVQRRTVVIAKGGAKERLPMSEDPVFQKESAKPDEQKAVSRARLREELGDIGALMRAVSVSPQAVGGYQGLRILDMQPGSYIEELGLKKDDLLLGANGKPLRGFGDLGGLGDLADKSTITLEVLRNGKKTIIRYDVQS